MALTKIDDRGLNTPIDLLDNEKIRLGTGNDLEIYHDGSNSIISDAGTGGLEIQSNGTGIYLQKSASEYLAKFLTDGAIELFHDNSKKFETTSTGVKLTGSGNLLELDGGNAAFSLQLKETSGAYQRLGFQKSNHLLQLGEFNNAGDTFTEVMKVDAANNVFGAGDNIKLNLGTGDDLQLYHDGSTSYIKDTGTGALVINGSEIHINSADNSDNCAKFVSDGAAELYYDGTKKLESTSYGTLVTGRLTTTGNITAPDSAQIQLGDGIDLAIYHNGSNSYIVDSGTGALRINSNDLRILNAAGSEDMIRCQENGSVELYYDNVKKIESTADGVSITGEIQMTDHTSGTTGMVILGADGDAKLFHNNSNTIIQTNTGELRILMGDENGIIAKPDGVVDLYCDNQLKFSTHSSGVQLHGDSKFKHDGWRGLLDRSWSDYPGIGISPDTTYGTNTEFRLHGDSASNLGYLGGGADFALVVRTDGSFEEGSDRRRKSNIEEITGALAIVKQLTGKKFNIINREGDIDAARGSKKQYGLIAQECKDIIPEVVHFHPDEDTPNENGWASAYGLDYGQLTPLLINAVKELSTAIDTLNTKVAALEAA